MVIDGPVFLCDTLKLPADPLGGHIVDTFSNKSIRRLANLITVGYVNDFLDVSVAGGYLGTVEAGRSVELACGSQSCLLIYSSS
jgi:hypothetical protein